MKFLSPVPRNAALLSLALSIVPALTTPTPNPKPATNNLLRREETDEEKLDRCTYKSFDFNEDDRGRLMCEDISTDYVEPYTCEECFGIGGKEPLKTGAQVQCKIVTDRGGEWDELSTTPTACPGDDVPETDPDGNPSKELYEGILDAWCAAAGSGGLFGFANMFGCYAWAFSQADNTLEENKAGVNRKATPSPFPSLLL